MTAAGAPVAASGGREGEAERGAPAGALAGLYISRGLVERHGGRIWCQSRGRGLGTSVSFALPTGTAPVKAEGP